MKDAPRDRRRDLGALLRLADRHLRIPLRRGRSDGGACDCCATDQGETISASKRCSRSDVLARTRHRPRCSKVARKVRQSRRRRCNTRRRSDSVTALSSSRPRWLVGP